jgi:alpha-1,3-fucosyltransferase
MTFNPDIDNNFYNLTMTYRLDSDVIWTYGEVRNLENNKYVAPKLNPKWKEADLKHSGKVKDH